MITVKMREEDLLNDLVERVKVWTDDEDVINLYKKMYKNYIYGGCFDGCEIDIIKIVDNDWHDLDVVCEGEEGYDGINELYEEQGLGDISCEHDKNNGYSFIEAEYNGMYLMRW